ncbi:MAG: 3-oxoacyl-ACP synthase, partial [Desulfobacterales bacterium]|nr:3-oxoacyl-ACP synthase [Desulfobacterales bacterium]
NGGDLILPNLEGITRTIRLGLESADITPDTVDFISAHATGTKLGDVVESQAIERVYGKSARVSALKSYIGHTMASCGAIETIFTLYMMEKGFIAPTLHLDKIDPRCAGINHVTETVQAPVHTAAVQNFAFGGVNTNLIFKTFRP